MLFHLVKKDLILAKKYVVAMFIFAIIGPIFIISKLGFSNGSSISFLITVLFVEFILFNMISGSEDKYKGSALLCTTPYKRNGVIKAKYLLIFVIYMGCFILFNVATVIGASFGLERLTVTSVGTSLLVVSIFFGILIPVQIHLGYEKTKYVSFIIVFITPFILPSFVQWFQSNNININFDFMVSLPQVNDWLSFVVSIVIGFISMQISIRLYQNKNL